ncbi:hypothetical protein [Nocardioides ultimimeridianus]
MPASSGGRGRLFSVESIAGWVFADLLLVLFLVGLGSAVAYTPPPPPPKPPKVAPIVGMKTDPTKVTISFSDRTISSGTTLTDAQSKQLCHAVRRRIGSLHEQRAALVLVFGGASDVVAGQNVARAVASQLGCSDPSLFGRKVANRAFWDGTLPLGEARLEIFLFTTQGGER